MDFRDPQGRPKRPVPPRQQSTSTSVKPTATGGVNSALITPSQSLKRWLIPLTIAAVLLAGAIGYAVLSGKRDAPAGDRYQAVFLDNGQVFFGKLKNTHGAYLTLENAYYTQKQNTATGANAEQKTTASSNISLARVGDEVYGPESTLKIKAEQVLFWQNLKNDSKITKAINDAS